MAAEVRQPTALDVRIALDGLLKFLAGEFPKREKVSDYVLEWGPIFGPQVADVEIEAIRRLEHFAEEVSDGDRD